MLILLYRTQTIPDPAPSAGLDVDLSPKRVFDPSHEFPVPRKFVLARRMMARLPPGAVRCLAHRNHVLLRRLRAFCRKFETDLAAAFEFDIYLREQFGVEQGAVLYPVAAVDPVARAKCIERQFRAGVPFLGKGDGIDHSAGANRFTLANGELGIEKAEVEACVVRDKGRIADKIQQFVRCIAEQWLVRKKRCRKAVHRFCAGRHVSFRIVVSVEHLSCRDEVEHFDAAYFNHPVTLLGVQSGCFGIKNDLTH